MQEIFKYSILNNESTLQFPFSFYNYKKTLLKPNFEIIENLLNKYVNKTKECFFKNKENCVKILKNNNFENFTKIQNWYLVLEKITNGSNLCEIKFNQRSRILGFWCEQKKKFYVIGIDPTHQFFPIESNYFLWLFTKPQLYFKKNK